MKPPIVLLMAPTTVRGLAGVVVPMPTLPLTVAILRPPVFVCPVEDTFIGAGRLGLIYK